MKKIINKLVFCLICFSCNAFADEFIYGKLVAGFQNNQQQNTSIDVRSGVVDYGSYFGIHGHEQLTEQTLFIWQVEQFLDISSGQSYNITTAGGLIMPRDNTSNGMPLANINQLATSDSYIGIQSSWGSIKLGNLSSYLRANMGAVDVFNYGNSSNGLNIWSRTSNNMVLPSSFFYNSSIWNGFTLGFQYSYTNAFNLGPNFDNSLANNGTGNNGYYSDGIFSFGLAWTHGNFKINYGAQLWPKVGAYNGQYLENTIQPVGSNAQYDNAYVNRLEVSYNDPDGIFMAIGAQVTSGLGWYGWANSGGSFNNYIVNSGFNYASLSQKAYQTQEYAISAGYHLGEWTPKLAYVYGNNMMYGGSIGEILVGRADQIPDTGYQQIVAEIDLNLSPRTILFANYGQTWFGSTLQNIQYCGINCNNGNPGVNGNVSNQTFLNQSTFAIGMSHVF